MELNWSTFGLEILNFLVLLWILKRFLYRPVLDVITQRRAGIEKTLADARAIKDEAEALKSRYELRLEEWGLEKEESREALRRELAEERERMLIALSAELGRERDRDKVVEERRQQDALRKYQEICLAQSARFVARLLTPLAGPELEARLFDLAMSQLADLPNPQLATIRHACEECPEEAEVTTAYPLDENHRAILVNKLGDLLGMPVVCRFSEDAELLAGLRIVLGPWVFQANLQDELKSFADSSHDVY